MKKEKWSKRHSGGFRKWLITVLLIETFAGYSHEEIDLERYRKKDRAKF